MLLRLPLTCVALAGSLWLWGAGPWPAQAQTETGAQEALQTGAEGETGTLARLRARGVLLCGVSAGLPGLAAPDGNGIWQGFEVALCRALAAAVLDDPFAVRYVPGAAPVQLRELAAGAVDVLPLGPGNSFRTDTDKGVRFTTAALHDVQGFLTRREGGAASARDLAGEVICLTPGPGGEQGVAEYFAHAGLEWEPLFVATPAEALAAYGAGLCRAVSAGTARLASLRAALPDAEAHVLLPETVGRQVLGPVVARGDEDWAAIVTWMVHALVAAEELGVTSANVEELARGTEQLALNMLLGTAPGAEGGLGLGAEWARRAVVAGGNYGEIFAGTLGEDTPLGLPRGLNALWTQGGLIHAPPFR
ncbi:MAG: transporter substrate-binding domain-containing protein [Rhodobacteraceae bacterium]|nr:transporter substrate-binding domain-containing protein [Paracoccaceae bacterium]